MVPPVSATFESLGLSSTHLAVLGELGYSQPTPIQTASIPELLAGKDLIGQSMTGSGKTAAFALPILQKLDMEARSLQALVLCPTRELCAQVAREIRKLGRKQAGLAVLEVVGGQPMWRQLDALRRGVHLVVGTPGRLIDHLQRGSLGTQDIQTVVLDEADRMLDMGFGADVESILQALPAERQTALFSATFPSSIEALCRKLQRNATRVSIDSPSERSPEIHQLRLEAEGHESFHALCWLLHKYPHDSALIFCNYKTTVLELARALSASGLSAGRLDGDLDQYERDQVLARFRNQSVRILVATDVAGRGIDVSGLDLVINYELPAQPDDYVHRIGRTGRAGKAGLAVALTMQGQEERVSAIQNLTGVKLERLTRNAGNDPGLPRLIEKIARNSSMMTILISAGRKDKVRPGDILGALTGEAGGLEAKDVGKIEIHDRLSYVAIASPVARHATQQLNVGRLKRRRVKATLITGLEQDRPRRGR